MARVLTRVNITIAEQGTATVSGACYAHRTAEAALIWVSAEKHLRYAPHSVTLDQGRNGQLPAIRIGREDEPASPDTVVTFDEHRNWDVFAVYQDSAELAVVLYKRPA